MLKSNKHVFWEALLVTAGLFVIGIFLGMLIETGHSSQISNLYLNSEINLVDGMATSRLLDSQNIDCETLKKGNIEFADKVYEEGKLLDEYESAGKLIENLNLLHRKYDLLRTMLWISSQNSLERCDNYDLIVYLYEFETEETVKKATQNVWSKILLDAKRENEDILLIPIAADQNLTSLNILIAEHNVTKFPAVIINNDEIIYTLENANQIQSLLN